MIVPWTIAIAIAGAGSTPVCLGSFQGIGLLIEQDTAVARIVVALDTIGADVKVPTPGSDDCVAKIPRIDFTIMRIGTILQIDVRVVRPAGGLTQALSLSIDSPSFPQRRQLAKRFTPLLALIAPATTQGPRANTASVSKPTAAEPIEPNAANAATGESAEVAAVPRSRSPEPQTEMDAPPTQTQSSIRTMPIVLWSAAAVFGIVAVVVEVDAVGHGNTAHALYDTNAPGAQVEIAAANGRARTSEGAAIAFSLAATALAAGGLISWLTGDSPPAEATAGAAVTSTGTRVSIGWRY